MWKKRVVKLLALGGLAAIVVHQWPEIHRYMKIKRM
ncbi:DUF6893 family small protein [Nonomuraea deserti]|jgi:hypothetical protein